MDNPTTITIPAPQYDKNGLVWVNSFEEDSFPTYIKARAYDPDRGQWIYLLGLTGRWHDAKDLAPRSLTVPEDEEINE